MGLIVIVIWGSYSVRSDASYPAWITWIAVVFVLYAPVYVLVLSPRLVKNGAQLPLIQWAGALSSFLMAWGAWFALGGPVWLLVVGVLATAGTLAALAAAARQE